ncbi:mariner Mos1 transposase [Trichonephila clavipes]|nr:mariner Mos1 transposase [Trichonephila clavipes]
MGKIIKVGRSVPHALTDRQQENRQIVCEILLAPDNRKSYLHRIVTGDEKWIYFENPKRNRSYVDLGQPSKSTARPNHFGRKTMVPPDPRKYTKRQHKVIFLYDNAPNHRDKPTKDIVTALGWEPLAYVAYSPDLAPSNYHLFASLGHALADQRFTSYENVKSWLDD